MTTVTETFCEENLRHCKSDNYTEEVGCDSITLSSLVSSSSCGRSCSVEVIRKRIAAIVQEDYQAVTVTVSGMAAIFSSLRLTQSYFQSASSLNLPHQEIVVFGFPYLDTLKVRVGNVYISYFFTPVLALTLPLCCSTGCCIDDQIMQRPEFNPGGVHFLGQGDESDLLLLEELLEEQAEAGDKRVVAVFTEFPSNPLLKSPDLKRY